MASTWNATSMRMECSCSLCRVGSCLANQFRTNISCTGNQTFDQGCQNCSSCNLGEYILSPPGRLCNGLGFQDTTAGWCKQCRLACSSGFYLNASSCLTGMDTSDRNCMPCNSKCPFGMYAFGRCDGTSFVDARKCVPCSSCLPGQVQTAFCYGNSTVDSTQCKTCNVTSCPPPQVFSPAPLMTLGKIELTMCVRLDQVLMNQCTGLDTVDRSRCVTCGTQCGGQEYMSRLCSFAQGFAMNASLYDQTCTACKSKCEKGQYIRIACSGGTCNDTVCSACKPFGCNSGEYLSTECSGETTKDTAVCNACTCPAGKYASNNTCTGKTSSNDLNCTTRLTAASCIRQGSSPEYLSGTCSTFSNPVCMPCRSSCGPAEIEVQACTATTDRQCLPDPACFAECPPGSYETRACRAPNILQVCAPCSKCAAGSYVSGQCKGNSDTQCQQCTAAHCPADGFNANFGSVGGCRGTETDERQSVQCGVITESYGEPCAPNTS